MPLKKVLLSSKQSKSRTFKNITYRKEKVEKDFFVKQ